MAREEASAIGPPQIKVNITGPEKSRHSFDRL
jgi:hypothetical protein